MREFRVFGIESGEGLQHDWPETNQSPVLADSPREAAERHFEDRLAFIKRWPHTPNPIFRDRLAILDPEEQDLCFFEYRPAELREIEL